LQEVQFIHDRNVFLQSVFSNLYGAKASYPIYTQFSSFKIDFLGRVFHFFISQKFHSTIALAVIDVIDNANNVNTLKTDFQI
jgi:hypothetical protein